MQQEQTSKKPSAFTPISLTA